MSIEGAWYNRLGSETELTIKNGSITGSYTSKVGKVAGKYVLAGRYDAKPKDDHGTAVSWSVSWHNEQFNANSVTSWSGQYLAGKDDEPERIIMLWLLTREKSPTDLWESTMVGQDIFVRTKPSVEKIQYRADIGTTASHPLY